MSFEYKIAEKIENIKPKALSIREIGKKLGLFSKFELDEMAKVINKMVATGTLIEVGHERYSLVKSEVSFRGVLRGNKRGFAFLIKETGGEDIFIPNKSLNGAMNGDTVIVKIVRGDEGKVTDIISRGVTKLVGTYETEGNFGFVVPDDNNYFCDIFVPKKASMNAADDTKVIVEIVKFEANKNPEGKIIEIIGKAGDKQTDVLSILKSYGFFNYFPEECLTEAKKMQYQPTTNRTSFVDMPTITIDGDDSKDLDDAISLLKVGDNYKLYVHIADVSHYVVKDSILDKEAFSRCTSVYFPGSVYPMLPPILSNGICSLNEGEDRLTLTCIMTFNKKGELLESRLEKSIINNDYRMTYKNVKKILDEDKELCEKYSEILPMIKDMYDLSLALKENRAARGSINFETKESQIVLDESGNVESIKPYEYTVANEIIEEFMLIANETVAEIMNKKKLPFVYRVHEMPDSEKIQDFRKFLDGCGLMLPKGDVTPKILRNLLSSISGNPLETIISKVMLRSMKKARYTTDNLGHFGLAAEYYCHFTSPIRRYPDLQIHRIIKAMLDDNLTMIAKLSNWCTEVATVSSEREKASESAERDIDDFYKAEYMIRHIGEEFVGIVSGVTSFGVFVELENTCEGLARLINLPQDKYDFIEERFTLKGSKHIYTLGQRVKIKVLACSVAERRVSFEIIENIIG